MKKIIAINASPRTTWNTAQLVQSAADGAADAGAEIEIIDLYKLDAFMGCRSCFACMTEKHYGTCMIKDGLTETLAKLREADGVRCKGMRCDDARLPGKRLQAPDRLHAPL